MIYDSSLIVGISIIRGIGEEFYWYVSHYWCWINVYFISSVLSVCYMNVFLVCNLMFCLCTTRGVWPHCNCSNPHSNQGQRPIGSFHIERIDCSLIAGTLNSIVFKFESCWWRKFYSFVLASNLRDMGFSAPDNNPT